MTFPRKTEGGLLPKRAEDGGGHAAPQPDFGQFQPIIGQYSIFYIFLHLYYYYCYYSLVHLLNFRC